MRMLMQSSTRCSVVAATLVCLLMAADAHGQDKPAETVSAPVPKVQLNQAALDKLGWRIGCQAYTFRALSLFETIDLLHSMGIHYIEMYPGQRYSPEDDKLKADHNLPPEKVDQLLKKLKDADVTAVLYGVVGLSKDEAESRKVFDFAKKMGLETIVSEPPTDAFEVLDRLANEYQINVAIHDHPKPSIYWDCHTVLKVSEGRSQRIGACADIGHWRRSELTPVDCIRMLKGRIISLHVKDIDEHKEDVIWGSGKVDVRAVLTELKEQGAKPIFSVEYEKGKGDELIANVAKSIEFFNHVATELAGKDAERASQ